MTKRIAILSALIFVFALSAAAQQRGRPVPTGPAPRLPDGKPDLSGVWTGGGPVADIRQGLTKGESIPLLPEAEKIMKSRQSKDDPEANCLPTGIPRIAPYPWRIVQTPTHIFFLIRREYPQLPPDLHECEQASR